MLESETAVIWGGMAGCVFLGRGITIDREMVDKETQREMNQERWIETN